MQSSHRTLDPVKGYHKMCSMCHMLCRIQRQKGQYQKSPGRQDPVNMEGLQQLKLLTSRALLVLKLCLLIQKHLSQVTTLVHAHEDVTTTNKLPIDVDLGDCGPL